MENLKKENEALKSYIETLKTDREILMSQIIKRELRIENLKLQNKSLREKIECLKNIKN